MSVNAMFHKCLYNLFLNSKRLIEFLISNGKEFQNVWLRKKKDLLRLLMLVAVEAIFVQMRDYLLLGAYCEDNYFHYKE